MPSMELKNFNDSDEVRTLPKTNIEVLNFNNATVMQASFEPGWKWSECVKPSVETETCEVNHVVYVLSGRMHIVMDDGTEKEIGPTDVAEIPPGHDAWTVGDEPCVLLDFSGGIAYGSKP